MDLATIVFYIFAALTLASAVVVITAKNPVHSVLFLIFAFFNAAALFVLLGAEYIAMTLVIVYVGAVAVLFLFVVMMLNVNFSELRAGFIKNVPLGMTMAGILFLELILMLKAADQTRHQIAPSSSPTPNAAVTTNTEAIGNILYTDFIYLFQLSGLVLLVAMIGAIVLTLREREGVKKQNIGKQINRKREDSISVVKVNSGEGV